MNYRRAYDIRYVCVCHPYAWATIYQCFRPKGEILQ
jgi:hypothetical protein